MSSMTRYQEWWVTRTQAEYELHHLALKYEDECFRDIRLELKEIQRRLLTYQVLDANGEWVDEVSGALGDLSITIDGWTFSYHRFRDGTLGRCDLHKKAILIRHGLRGMELRATLLHELLHAYEHELPDYYREWLAIWLYNPLLKNYSKRTLNRCLDSMHTLLYESHHNPMFLLKSLDLDRRYRFKLGTVFGYGRAELFA